MEAISVEDTAKERGYQHFIFSDSRLFVEVKSRWAASRLVLEAIPVEDTAKERGYQHFIFSDLPCLLKLKHVELHPGLYWSHFRRRYGKYGKRKRLPALHLFRFAFFVEVEITLNCIQASIGSHSRRRYGKRERLPALHLFRFALFVDGETTLSCIQVSFEAISVEDTAKERGYQHFIFSDSRCLLKLKSRWAASRLVWKPFPSKIRQIQRKREVTSTSSFPIRVVCWWWNHVELHSGLVWKPFRSKIRQKREVTSTSSFPIRVGLLMVKSRWAASRLVIEAIPVEDTAKERGYQHFIFSDSRCLLKLKHVLSCIQACIEAIPVEDTANTAKERGYQHFIFSDSRFLLKLKSRWAAFRLSMEAISVEDTAKERGYQHFIFSDSRCLLDGETRWAASSLVLKPFRLKIRQKREVTSTSSFPIRVVCWWWNNVELHPG